MKSKRAHFLKTGLEGKILEVLKKDNGAEVELGFFKDDNFLEISAILFSTTATWGKVEVMSNNSDITSLKPMGCINI